MCSHTGRLLGRQASRILGGLCLVESRRAESMAERMPVLRRKSRAGKARALGVGRFSAHGRCKGVSANPGHRSLCGLVAQLCPTLSNPMECSLPGSIVHTGVGYQHFLPRGIFLTQGLNPGLLHWQADSLPLNHLGSPWTEILAGDKHVFVSPKGYLVCSVG